MAGGDSGSRIHRALLASAAVAVSFVHCSLLVDTDGLAVSAAPPNDARSVDHDQGSADAVGDAYGPADSGTSDGAFFGCNAASDAKPVGYWPFDEASGTIARDCGGNGLDGVVSEPFDWVVGRKGGALHFTAYSDGGRGRVDLGRYSAFDFSSDFTVAAWVKLDAPGGNADIVARPYSWGLGFASGSAGFIVGNGSSGDVFVVGGPVPVGEWVHVAGVFRSRVSAEVYRNGVAQSTATDATSADRPSTHVILNDGFEAFSGSIDDLVMFNRALSASEVSALAQ